MPEAEPHRGPPEMPQPPRPDFPTGAPLYLFFGGIVEGPREDASIDATLHRVTEDINQLGFGTASLELDGGRFSILLAEDSVAGDRITEAHRTKFTAILQELISAVGDGKSVESTLRCTEVYEHQTVESLFAPVGGEMQSIGRVREISDEDRRRAPAVIAAARSQARTGIGRGRGLLILVLATVALGLLAWQQGLIDRVFATEGASLAVEMPGLHDSLAAGVESSWGVYVVTLRRGSAFPETPASRDALLQRASTNAEIALLRAVVDGGELYVRLENAADTVLQAVPIGLRALLSAADGSVSARLRGRIDAHHLRIALDPGPRPEPGQQRKD